MLDLCRSQQGLGRDTAPVQADAAKMFALDDRHLQAELRRPDRRDVTARSRADDDDVECCLRHGDLRRQTHAKLPAVVP